VKIYETLLLITEVDLEDKRYKAVSRRQEHVPGNLRDAGWICWDGKGHLCHFEWAHEWILKFERGPYRTAGVGGEQIQSPP
jgi:hypothetical protein